MNSRNIYGILSCYEEKPIRREKTKPQTATVISLWCWDLLSCSELYCDWSLHNEHSWKISGVHGFLSLTVIDNCFHNYFDNLCNYDVSFNRPFHRTIAVWPLPLNIWQYCTENRYDDHLFLLVTAYSEILLYLFNPQFQSSHCDFYLRCPRAPFPEKLGPWQNFKGVKISLLVSKNHTKRITWAHSQNGMWLLLDVWPCDPKWQ